MSVATRLRGHRDAGVVHVVATAEPAAPPATYVGLVTRLLAFGVDAAVINGAAALTAALAALGAAVLSLPEKIRGLAIAAAGTLYVLWTIAYFVTFWSTTGQTPGARMLRMRVVPKEGGRLKPRRAVVRFGAMVLAALPLFAGYLLILVDDRRRGLHDVLARTIVVDAPRDRLEAPRRAGPRPADG